MKEAERIAQSIKRKAEGGPSDDGRSGHPQQLAPGHPQGSVQPPAATLHANQGTSQQPQPTAQAGNVMTEKQQDEVANYILKLTSAGCADTYTALGGAGDLTGNVAKKRMRVSLFGANREPQISFKSCCR